MKDKKILAAIVLGKDMGRGLGGGGDFGLNGSIL